MEYTFLSNQEEDDLISPRISNRSRYLLLVTLIFGGSFFLFFLNYTSEITYYRKEPTLRQRVIDNEESFAINTEGCIIPAMKPLDESIIEFVKYPKQLKPCPNSNYPLTGYNSTHLWINKNNKTLLHYKIISQEHLTCCYKSFYRPIAVKDVYSRHIDERIVYNKCVKFSDVIKVLSDEFVAVECFYGEKTVYKQYYIFAPKKEIILHDKAVEIPENKSAYNVIILGIDNVSRMNFHRTMPKTLNYLLDNGAIELMGYNKVGDNSYPNLIALLLGHNEAELKKICHPFYHVPYDECPFLWHWYKEAGYYTAFGEDISSLGTFNYLSDGFMRTPTDYYMHPFMFEAQKKVGTYKELNSELCMGDKYFYQVLLDYIDALTTTLSHSKMFAFFWEITMSHDFLNHPMTMDDNYFEFLKRLEAKEYLDKSIFIVMSDHGIRWGPIRSTKQGRLEELLPFVFILTPPSFKNTYRNAFTNLMINSRRLTTPFDMHETLLDLIDLDRIKDEKVAFRTKESYETERGISLFLPVSTNRTCKAAGILDHWCSCQISKKISPLTPKVKDAANQLISQINHSMKDHPRCANLSQADIVSASEMVTVTKDKTDKDWTEYLVVVKTEPGDGVFEATLRNTNGSWSLKGTASRLNLYGNQSWCVDNAHLKLYCFCI